MWARSCAAHCVTKCREAEIRLPRHIALGLAIALLAAAAAAGEPAPEPATEPVDAVEAVAEPAVDAAAVAPPVAVPEALAVPPHYAKYNASVRGIPVRLGLRLEPLEDGTWQYRSWAEPRGLLGFINRELTETSILTVTDGRVIPISYRKRDEFGDRDSAMQFDAEAGIVHIEYRGRKNDVDWEPGIYDLQSLRVALAHDLARGELGDVYRVVDDRGRVDTVDVTVAAREPLKTKLGRLDTIRLEYYSERRDRLFRLWLAPDMDAALVALEQYEGDSLRGRLEIVEYQRLETAVP